MAKNIYPCSQEQLYTIADSAWNLYLLHIGDFTAFSKTFTLELYEQKVKDIMKAAQMKTQPVLKKELLQVKKQLIAAKKNVLYNYTCIVAYAGMNKSSGHIPVVNMRKIYRKASNNNWDYCRAIGFESQRMVTDYFNQLTCGDNMPQSFAAVCKKAASEFNKLYVNYTCKQQAIKAETCFKVTANNEIYKNVTAMLRYAQLIYRNRSDMQMLFQFDKLLRKTKNANKIKHKQITTKPFAFLSKVAAMF
jgi:hypothetical protein